MNRMIAMLRRLGSLAAVVVLPLWTTAAHAVIPAGQRAVLLNLYTSTNGGTWITRTNWNGSAGTECTWFGVTCDSTGSTVTGINLSQNNLTGTLPSLSGLTNLQQFAAASNQLTGAIPSLSGLTNLSFFNVSVNKLTGSIPALAGLTNLQIFSVVSNQLTGSIPSLTGLANLQSFGVGFNQLTGLIPLLAGLTNLQIFSVVSNQLTGSIPALTSLTNLQQFIVSINSLNGPIPPLTGLKNLQFFDAHRNQMTGSIPSLSGLTNLQQFSVDSNQLTGTIPSLSGLTSLSDFVVDNNLLTGALPSLSGLTNLQQFSVDSNQLTGTIPSLTGLMRLQLFQVGTNRLTGSIPSLTGLTNLQRVDVRDNQLVGSIPSLTGLTSLMNFFVSSNQLTGNVPSVPSPNALVAGGSRLCPNLLSPTPDPAWDAATGVTPWYANCGGVPTSIKLGGYLSGNWFNPAQNRHGFQFEFTNQSDSAIPSEKVMLASWYVYTPDGSGQNQWIYAQGPYDSTRNSVTLPATILYGARFPFPLTNYNPADVKGTLGDWGSLTFTFTDCNNGTASWNSTVAGYGNGSIPITRLTSIQGTTCPQ